MGIFDRFKKNKNIENENGWNELIIKFSDDPILGDLRNKPYEVQKGNKSNGQKEGEWKVYDFKDGYLTSEGIYVNDKKEGDWIIYNTPGYLDKIARKGPYKNDVPDGFWIIYDDLDEHSVRISDGRQEGNFKKGIRVGKWTFYDRYQIQKITKEVDYVEGKTIGKIALDNVVDYLKDVREELEKDAQQEKVQKGEFIKSIKKSKIDENYIEITFQSYRGHNNSRWNEHGVKTSIKRNDLIKILIDEICYINEEDELDEFLESNDFEIDLSGYGFDVMSAFTEEKCVFVERSNFYTDELDDYQGDINVEAIARISIETINYDLKSDSLNFSKELYTKLNENYYFKKKNESSIPVTEEKEIVEIDKLFNEAEDDGILSIGTDLYHIDKFDIDEELGIYSTAQNSDTSSNTSTDSDNMNWFNGKIYEEGGKVTNPHSGKSFELNNIELSIYDHVIGLDFLFSTSPNTMSDDQIKSINKCLKWFKENNPEAYKVLLE